MDAREQLRRFLEQRREMGETELILDSMTVDEVMRIVGAPGGRSASAATPSRSTSASTGRTAAPSAVAPTPAPTNARTAPVHEPTADWREIMRASDAAAASGATPAEASHVSPPPGTAEPTALRIPGIDAPLGLVVGPTEHDLENPFRALTTLEQLAETIAKCTRCPLFATATKPVPGQGNPNADLVCVGEAPGANEDLQGLAFVGQAGQLLTKILEAVQLGRDDVFIVNVLKHRPPGNRNPLPLEVEACAPYLVRQLELIRPKVILALGTFAAQTLLNTKLSIGKLRGSVHRYYGIPTIVTYHPAALLRNPAWKRPTWEDVQLARRILDSASANA